MTDLAGEFSGDRWIIEPAGPLQGDICVRGAKNAVTKHMVAAMLGDRPSTIRNAPEFREVDITKGILESVGVGVEQTESTITVTPIAAPTPRVPTEFSQLNRIPILLLGPLLARVGEAFVPLVGGDRLGQRPVDFHVNALEALGAEVEVHEDGIWAKADRLRGARITLPYPSVMATETVLLAAVLAEGRTLLSNAATEPEVIDLALFLQRMGASIELQPDRRIIIEGVSRLDGAGTTLAGDRIEAFSYLCAGLVTGGKVRVRGCSQDRLVTAINTLHRMGAHVEISDDGVAASASEPLRAAPIATDTHPGFMTDWQPPLVVLMSQAVGLSVVHETVFENRFGFVGALQKMGAEIEVYTQCLGGPACRFYESNELHSAIVKGPAPLSGADLVIQDIRAGFAWLIAAAAASGRSTLSGVHHIERGYHQALEGFRSIGLDVQVA